MQMPFGKHKGIQIEEIPHSYLIWVLENCNLTSQLLEDEIKKVLGLSSNEDPTPEVLETIKQIYKNLAIRFHPDKGGSTQAMVAINVFWDEIQKKTSSSHFFV